jgi:large subunit ribosomal protein L23
MEVIKRPIVTEKMTGQADSLSRYGFVVDKAANKLQIKKAVEELYNVSVLSVNTLRYAGKIKSRNTKSGVQVGKTAATKRAVITLKKGESIDFYSNI